MLSCQGNVYFIFAVTSVWWRLRQPSKQYKLKQLQLPLWRSLKLQDLQGGHFAPLGSSTAFFHWRKQDSPQLRHSDSSADSAPVLPIHSPSILHRWLGARSWNLFDLALAALWLAARCAARCKQLIAVLHWTVNRFRHFCMSHAFLCCCYSLFLLWSLKAAELSSIVLLFQDFQGHWSICCYCTMMSKCERQMLLTWQILAKLAAKLFISI